MTSPRRIRINPSNLWHSSCCIARLVKLSRWHQLSCPPSILAWPGMYTPACLVGIYIIYRTRFVCRWCAPFDGWFLAFDSVSELQKHAHTQTHSNRQQKCCKHIPMAVLLRPSPLYRNCATSCGSVLSSWFSYKNSIPVMAKRKQKRKKKS